MLQLHVLLDQPKEWLDYISPVGALVTAVAAVITVVVARRIARNQNTLQQMLADRQLELQKAQLEQQDRQLRKDLFDRRFDVYTGLRDFMHYVMREPDNIEFVGQEFHVFRTLTEKAEMLFGADVNEYLHEVDKVAGDIYVNSKHAKAKPGDVEVIQKGSDLFSYFTETLWPRRSEVFRPYFRLD